ncbi:MAG: hypothetical protein KGO83_04440, partial [Paenibacillaceae bacterium]|nr:hypothetical protein [Paenibacillaceae bacterium]
AVCETRVSLLRDTGLCAGAMQKAGCIEIRMGLIRISIQWSVSQKRLLFPWRIQPCGYIFFIGIKRSKTIFLEK